MMIRDRTHTSIKVQNGNLLLLDQTVLPTKEVWLDVTNPEDLCSAIVRLSVRGAPLIGVAAALGLAIHSSVKKESDKSISTNSFLKVRDDLISTRPTAVNLQNAMRRMSDCIGFKLSDKPGSTTSTPDRELSNLEIENLIRTAEEIVEEDVELCKKIANNAASIIKSGDNIVHHCNTGSLATAGVGTALGAIITAYKDHGKAIHVYVDETRPLLQGGRLTTYELEKAGVPHTLITDSMAAILMKEGKIDLAMVGCDRVALNGDFANKVGTYSLAVNCYFHHVPFYVLGPYTTIDTECSTGKDIPIEQRTAAEVQGVKIPSATINWSPPGCSVFNPAFDVTPVDLVTALVTDAGVFTQKDCKNGDLRQFCKNDIKNDDPMERKEV